jgi:hypothetical protein|tara:strand:+ start:11679 stop:12164 length:486 start_codon:yes stop_codon:yes gene_type:complete
MSITLLWIIVSILFVLGLVGTVVPMMPGIMLVFGGILLYGLVTGFEVISVTTVVILGITALIAIAADYAGGVLGARAGGGKWKSMALAALGALVGTLILGPFGLLFGAFIGGLGGAFLEGKEGGDAVKVGAISLVGIVGAMVFQFMLAIAMIATFFVAIFV